MERDEMMRPITQEMIDKVKQTIDNKVFYIKEVWHQMTRMNVRRLGFIELIFNFLFST